MQTTPLFKKAQVGRSSRVLGLVISASHTGSGSQPPIVPNPLDRVLNKAANKVKLAHPAAQQSDQQQQKPKEPATKRPTSRPAATRTVQHPKQRQPQTKQSVLDDDALFKSITESERDSVWQAFKLEVEGDADLLRDLDVGAAGRGTLPPQRRSAPASARDGAPSASPLQSQPVASSSGFKGFGSPPPRRPDPAASPASTSRPSAPTPASTATARAPAATARQQPQHTQHHKQPQAAAAASRPAGAPLRLFLFNAEEARTRTLLQQLGLAGRVDVVDDLRYADAVVAAKLARSGKHVNLTQGERTAANLGVPFVVVGRNMTADNLRAALTPLLDPKAAGAAAAGTAAAAAGFRPAASRAPTAAELQAHRLEVAQGFAELLRQGGVEGREVAA